MTTREKFVIVAGAVILIALLWLAPETCGDCATVALQ